MSEAPSEETGTALYVYGVVPATASNELFTDVASVDGEGLVQLVAEGQLAAITSPVPLREFGEAAIQDNLHDPVWLEDKVRAHDRVLEAALPDTTVLPFRFGTIYRGEDHVRALLTDRSDLARALARLEGTVELGVKAFLDRRPIKARLLAQQGVDESSPTSGRAYMQRRQVDRKIEEELKVVAAEAARDSHERLVAAALDGRMNPLPRMEAGDDEREVVLNGAYLVRRDAAERFHRAVAELEAAYTDEVAYQLTGPWPPYNFAEEDEARR